MSTTQEKIPWREGYWKMGDFKAIILQTSEDDKMIWKNLVVLDYPDIPIADAMVLHCQYGNFGKAHEEIASATGVDECNIKIKSPFINNAGVLNEDGTKITIFGVANSLEEWIWLDEAMLQKVKEDRDPFDSPSCPHITPQPEKKGPIYWLSGPPGSGKSTTCQMMAKEKGYVYYEADCIANLINPFTDINAENPSIAGFKSQPLKNVPKEIALAVLSTQFFNLDFKDAEEMTKRVEPFFKIMGEDIVRQKKRLGGTFAVAHAVPTRASRDFLRGLVGSDLFFIVLNITKECQSERLKGRHGEGQGGDELEKIFANFQPAGEEEPRAFNLTIEAGMSREEVMQKAFDIVNNIEE